MKKILAVSMALIFSQTAFAEWQTVISMDDFNVAIEKSRLKKIGDHYQAWVKYSLKDQKEINSVKFQSMLSLEEYDCKNEKSRKLDLHFYSDDQVNGKVVKSANETGEWNRPIPGSVSDSILNAVCYKNKKLR